MIGSPPSAPAAPSRRSPLLIILAVLLTIALLSMGGCIALFLSGSKASSEARNSADQFLSALERDDVASAQKLLLVPAAGHKTIGSVAPVLTGLAVQHGKPKTHEGPQGWRTLTRNGVTQVRMAYLEHFEKGQVPVEITCAEEGGRWSVAGFDFRP